MKNPKNKVSYVKSLLSQPLTRKKGVNEYKKLTSKQKKLVLTWVYATHGETQQLLPNNYALHKWYLEKRYKRKNFYDSIVSKYPTLAYKDHYFPFIRRYATRMVKQQHPDIEFLSPGVVWADLRGRCGLGYLVVGRGFFNPVYIDYKELIEFIKAEKLKQ